MRSKNKKFQQNNLKRTAQKQRIYYLDACVLETGQIVERTFNAMRKHKVQVLVSHLTLGEAFSNAFRKDEMNSNGRETQAFLELINSLAQQKNFKIVGNDKCGSVYRNVLDKTELTPTDALHLAVALYFKCEIIFTNDRDLLKLPKEVLEGLAIDSKTKAPIVKSSK